jgi:conjugative transposon TraM protein
MKTRSQQFLHQRKFFMVLPLMAIPFLTLFFWALGGGKGNRAQAKEFKITGLNLELPKAYFTNEDDNWNKFALYEQAKRDSLKHQRARESDPYYEMNFLTSNTTSNTVEHPETINREVSLQKDRLNASLGKKDDPVDPNEAKVNQKLEQLYRELAETPVNPIAKNNPAEYSVASDNEQFASDVDRLEQMMLMLQGSGNKDPEMQQIESVLEKILDIQYPERVREKVRDQSLQHRSRVFQVEALPKEDAISSFGDHANTGIISADFSLPAGRNAFYGLEEERAEEHGLGNTIEAVIHDTQELVSGSTVKMRLLNDIFINGRSIPKDRFIYGTCAINGERLTISIESIRTENSLLPVSLIVHDLDGLPGIYVPGAIANDVARQATGQTVQGLDFYSFDPSLGAQAANAGIQATKSLLNKKTKTIKVTVKAGYKILLKDSNAWK